MISNLRELALDIAQEIILHPENWTQGYTARNKDGRAVESREPEASHWCLIGMVLKRFDQSADISAAQQGLKLLGGLAGSIVDFNDHPLTTAESMIKFLRRTADNPTAVLIRFPAICVDN